MSMNRATLVGLIIIAVPLLAVGSYFAQDHLKCQALREDHLNSASSIKGSIAMKSVLGSDDEAANRIEDEGWASFKSSYTQLIQQCGERRAASAARETQAIIGGWASGE